MKTNKLILTFLLLAGSSQAGTVCQTYEKSGNFKIKQVCAEEMGQQTFTVPRFIATDGQAYPVSIGKNKYPKALFVCKQLGFLYAVVSSIKGSHCNPEIPALNTDAQVTFNSVLGSNDCLSQVQCSNVSAY